MTTGETTQAIAEKLRSLIGQGPVTLHLESGMTVQRVEIRSVARTAITAQATDNGPSYLIALDSIIGIGWTEKDSA
jgi:hypothetical protein